MRPISKIIVQSTKTKENAIVKALDIVNQHLSEGLPMVGFHYIIERDGTTVTGRSLSTMANHYEGEDPDSIAIAYIGGLDREEQVKDTRTIEQNKAIIELLEVLKLKVPEASNVYWVDNEDSLVEYK